MPELLENYMGRTNLQKCFSVRQLANALDVCERTIHRLIKRGEMGVIRVGRNIRVPWTEVKRWSNAQVEKISSQVDAIRELEAKQKKVYDVVGAKNAELMGENYQPPSQPA